jgi:hypothetical protein
MTVPTTDHLVNSLLYGTQMMAVGRIMLTSGTMRHSRHGAARLTGSPTAQAQEPASWPKGPG